MKPTYRIRMNGSYYVLEKLHNGKRIKSWSLNPKKLALKFECKDSNDSNVQSFTQQNIKEGV